MVDLDALKFSEGFVEGWIETGVREGRPGAARILEAWRIYINGFDELYRQARTAESRLVSIRRLLDS
jgi:hypothetical protein